MRKIPPLESIKPGQKIEIEIDESKSVIDMFVKNLYKRKTVMVQEIYSNELTAALKAAEMGKKPWIEITTNLDEGKMVIQGCESLGITPKILVEVATVLGASGNTDGTKPGMFGVGFAAPLGISEVILLSSLPIETGEQYDLMFAGSMENKASDGADLEHTGTRIQITLLPNVDMGELVTHLAKCARFAEIPTFLINERPLDDSLGELAKPGRQELVRDTHAGYIQNIRKLTLADEGNGDILGGALVNVKGDNFEFTGLYNPGGSLQSDDRQPHKVFTLNIPIDAEIELPDEMIASILNVTDATKLKPTHDRERLDDAAQKRINAVLPGLIHAELQKLNLKSLQDFIGTPHPRLYVNQDNSEMSLPWYDEKTENLAVHLLRRVCFWHEKNSYYDSKWVLVSKLLTDEKANGKKIPIVILPKYSASEKNAKKCGPERKDFNESEKKQHAWFDRVQNVYPENIIVSFPIKIYEFIRSRGYSEKDVIIAADKIPRE